MDLFSLQIGVHCRLADLFQSELAMLVAASVSATHFRPLALNC